MRLATFEYDGWARLGVVEDETVVEITAVAPTMLDLIKMGEAGLAQAAALSSGEGERIPLTAVTLLAPIPHPPRNVMCLGLNYAEHAAESERVHGREMSVPDFPVVFTKATTAVTGPYAPIPYDTAVSTEIDYEAELAVIIGRAGKNIPAAEAMAYVFGYTVLNDMTARDLQQQHRQYFKGKSLDGHCPMGPWIVTAGGAPDPHRLRITSRVNGVLKQDGRTEQMIFDIPATIMHLSRGMTLLPGDIIATGTPSGVGFARTPPEFLGPGDVVVCEVEKIGAIRNRISDQV